MDMKDIFMRLMYRNDELGLARFDPSDIESRFPFTWLYRRYPSRIARLGVRLLKIPAILAPITYRRILGVPRYICPTVYHHLGRAYWYALTWAPESADEWRSRLAEICDGALENSIMYNGFRTWGCGRDHMAVDGLKSAETPCAHMITRVGLLLLLAGKTLNEQKYIDAAVESGLILCKEFNWHTKPNGGLTVSFFVGGEDETINVCADTALLLAELMASGYEEEQFPERFVGLVRMINNEQDDHGKWMYVTHDYSEKVTKNTAADNSHSAFVISALIRILKTGLLEPSLAEKTRQTAAKGLEWYCKTFFRPDGFSFDLDNGVREASVTSYAEGVMCMCHAMGSDDIPTKLKDSLNLKNLAHTTLQRAIKRFVNCKTWDVASHRYGPVRVNMRSIRWGSGPLMEAISHYLAWKKSASKVN
ncbi:MAG: hypothetical protein J7L99_02475 [Planctomycetes bacterium]|nr:hypothetical protein [Planctomycetota bacterium]